MNNIRLLNQNDLDSYIELMKFGHHNYEWDRYYLENVSIDRLKTILSNLIIGIYLVLLKMMNLLQHAL